MATSECAYLSIIVLIIPGISSSVLQMTEAVQYVNITSLVSPPRKPFQLPSQLSATKHTISSWVAFGCSPSFRPMTYYESDRNVIKKPFSEGHSTRVLYISFQINNIRDNILLRIGRERKLKLFLKSSTSLTNYPSKVEMLLLLKFSDQESELKISLCILWSVTRSG